MPLAAACRNTALHLADQLEELVALHDAANIAAVIVEPMSGSGGVVVPPAGYLQRLRKICDRHDILLIFDEVITGFGRAGSLTGAEEFGVVPDILNLAKQLTNGAIPMGAVVVSETIHRAFMEAPKPPHAIELPHGYTYSAHPVACAAALASLRLFDTEGLIGRVRALAPHFEKTLHALRDAPHVVDIRNHGLAGAIQVGTPRRGSHGAALRSRVEDVGGGFLCALGRRHPAIRPPLCGGPRRP